MIASASDRAVAANAATSSRERGVAVAGRRWLRRQLGDAPLPHRRRVAGDDRAGGHVLGDHGARRDDGTVTDRDAVEHHDVRADPDVVPHDDATLRDRLPEHGYVGIGHRVVERQQRRVRPDPHRVPQPDVATDHRERVHRAVRTGHEAARDVRVARDVGARAEMQPVDLDRRQRRDEALLVEDDVVVARREPPLQRELFLLVGVARVRPEVPRRVVVMILVERIGHSHLGHVGRHGSILLLVVHRGSSYSQSNDVTVSARTRLRPVNGWSAATAPRIT